LEVDFAESSWIRIMTFDRAGASLPKRTTGATGENLKVSHHRSWAPGHPPAAKKINGIREGVKQNHEEVLN
jgi:hypothetical protein